MHPTGGDQKTELMSAHQRGKRIRALIVDDSEVALRAVCSILEREAMIEVVGTAADGTSALEQAEALEPDLILMDVQMPDMSGLSATELILAKLPTARIIVVTIHDSPEMRSACRASGAHGFVPKERLARELMPAIRRVFNMLAC